MRSQGQRVEPIFEKLVLRWTHPNYRSAPIPATELDEVERVLNTYIPQRIRDFLESCGAQGFSLDLSETILENGIDAWAIAEFYDPKTIIDQTVGWREIGMPVDLVAFASDGGGNQFCFRQSPQTKPRPVTAEIIFFDHELGDADPVATDFDAWIAFYAELPELT